jgi:biopolymer transport protein ExbB
MLRAILLGLSVSLVSSLALSQEGKSSEPATSGEDLNSAFQREYAFLLAQKKSLTEEAQKTSQEQERALEAAKAEISELEKKHGAIVQQLEKNNSLLEEIQVSGDNAAEAEELTASTLLQTQEALAKFKHVSYEGKVVQEPAVAAEATGTGGQLMALTPRLLAQMDESIKILSNLDGIRIESGSFYNLDGSKVSGDIYYVGNVAAYGYADAYKGSLAPAGSGELKAIHAETADSLRALRGEEKLPSVKMYLFESPYAEAIEQTEKSWIDVVDDGGRIAWIIFYMGVFAAILTVIRYIVLVRSSSMSKGLTKQVGTLIAERKLNEAIELCNRSPGVIAKVLSSTLRNIQRPRLFIEDIVNETIIYESRLIDKFGNFIIITSTVAPLLGLLGTVAGMIATFNMMTEYGTGNPKILSGGISEALICTMLGLAVAIPALLIGSLMNGWAEKIKDDMAHAALHISNIFQKRENAEGPV